MSRDSARALAATWRARGYDARIIEHEGAYHVLLLREDGRRYYVYDDRAFALSTAMSA